MATLNIHYGSGGIAVAGRAFVEGNNGTFDEAMEDEQVVADARWRRSNVLQIRKGSFEVIDKRIECRDSRSHFRGVCHSIRNSLNMSQ